MTFLSIQSRVRPQFIICLLLTVGTLLLYYPVGQFDFINYDDPGYVSQNRWVQSGLNRQSIKRAFTSFEQANWHPLTWLSHMLDVTLYGMNPGAHHLTNVQFHICNTLLLFLILLRMTGEIWKSAMVAALFATHPLHIESVAWISERKDVLSAFFFMLTLWFYVVYVEKPSLVRYFLVLAMFILGLLAKPMLVTLPFLLLLLDFWPMGRLHDPDKIIFLSSKQPIGHSIWFVSFCLLLEKAPLMILSGISSLMTFIVQHDGKAVSSLDILPIIVRIANTLVSYVTYIWKLIIPVNLSVFYPYPNILPLWKTAGSFLVIILISRLAIINFFKRPYMTTGWFWFLGMLVPVVGIVQVGLQSMADRYTYLPAIGLFIVGVWAGSEYLSKMRNGFLIRIIFSLLTLFALSSVTYYHLPYWKNSVSLFRNALKTTEQNILAHLQVGTGFMAQDQLEEAYNQLTMALKIKPKDATVILNIGLYHEKKNNFSEAINFYKEAIQLKPDDDLAYNLLGIVYTKQNYLEKAVKCFEKAIQINPEKTNLYCNLGVALAKQKRFSEAIKLINHALQIDKDFAAGHLNIGNILAETGDISDAIKHFSIALQLEPEDKKALTNLRQALKKQHQIDETIKKNKHLLESNSDYLEAHYNLAIIYKHIGKVEEAVKHYSEAIRINPTHSPSLQNLAIMYATKGQYDEALDLFKKIANYDPENPMGYYYTAGIYARTHQLETAVIWLQKAVEKGFSDMELLKNDVNMKNLRQTDYYHSLTSGNDTN